MPCPAASNGLLDPKTGTVCCAPTFQFATALVTAFAALFMHSASHSPRGAPAILICFWPTAGCLLLSTACSQPAAETAVAEATPIEDHGAHPDLVRIDPASIVPAGIRSAEVESIALESVIEAPGRIEVDENRTARVGAFVEGVVVECCVSVGADVKKGQVLARLHSHDVHDAESKYRQALAMVPQSESELEYAQQQQRRASRLHELKAGSLQKVQEAETALKSAETALEFAKAEVERAERHLGFLGLDPAGLAEHADRETETQATAQHAEHLIPIRAPFAGTVLERTASQGAAVTPSDPLYVISDLSRVWVMAQVPEQHLPHLRRGMPVEVSVRAYPDRVFPARVTTIGDALDPETRTVQVRCEAANPRRALKTEMFATIRIPGDRGDPSAAVPLSAIQHVDGDEMVFIDEGGGVYRARRVETGRRSDSKVEIVRGLEVGERAVVQGAFHLKSEFLKSQMAEDSH